VTSWIEVSEERLAENYRVLTQTAGAETTVLGVVKANAYGHGAGRCSVALARAGARWLGVATVSEGIAVRAALEGAGLSGEGAPEVLAMCGLLEEEAPAFAEHGLTPVVWTPQQAEWLRPFAGMRVHVDVDTGMTRQGVLPGAALEELLDSILAAGLTVDGVCTHFCAADVAGSEVTQAQQRRFERAVEQVRARGLRPRWVHAGSSSSLDNPAQERPWLAELAASVGARAMVRCGIALYGYCLPIAGGPASGRVRPELRPVMTWKTRVLDVREVAAGESVGYNATFTATRPMRLGMLPVGYSDGLRRELSSTNARPGGWVMVGGQRAAIVGRVSMNLTMVDVTEIAGVRTGDEVVVLGEGVTADDHARIAGTISYEILCGVGGAQREYEEPGDLRGGGVGR
jgi:alanine racemase